MASESPIPTSERRDEVSCVVCFGPYGDADTGGTNDYTKLPFVEGVDIVIDSVGYQCDAIDGNGAVLTLVQHSNGAPTGVVAAADRIHATVDAGSILTTPPTRTSTSQALTYGTITPGTHNNVVPAGTGLYLHANIATNALAGLIIHVRYRTRRK